MQIARSKLSTNKPTSCARHVNRATFPVMSPDLLIVFLSMASCIAVTIWQQQRQYEKGRAFGWQEGFFHRENRERERRQKNGQFKKEAV